ncbi:MAG: carboxypeptidase regulatory-like domain-containing protein, partial [Acidobacteria bacterium]|nr:carboxypeptidase regulatory-like domain-containing protein [Acidobacteriota bacterium]
MHEIDAAVLCLFLLPCTLAAQEMVLNGRVTDPEGNSLPQAEVQLIDHGRVLGRTTSETDGSFQLKLSAGGEFIVKVEVSGFRPVEQPVTVGSRGNTEITIRVTQLSVPAESVSVTADVNDLDAMTPDPAMKVFSSENLLDANPGRPGAPISIPGYPIETASGGIKAPQYFAPGVAGDHGQPIAQYIQVGSYLVPNNLSANAHGNGYADPNIYVASVIESVQIDGGAYNVREGNHALNLAAIYGLRSSLNPFVSLTADYHDATLTAGMSPSPNTWISVEGSFGNGFLDRLEHRKQFKVNGGHLFHAGDHTLTLFGIAYLGYGEVAGLRPIYGFNSVDTAAGWVGYPDTIDPRQKDQTHTALVALNDTWKLDNRQQLQLSGFLRTYNLSLYSDFGLGLIRQSEFRTVNGGNATYMNKLAESFTLLGGIDYQREAPRRDDLDHYNFYNPATPSYYGPFTPIDGSNVTITPITPFVALQGALRSHIRYYAGLRRDEISIDNQDLLTPANSWNQWVGLTSPKATLTFLPGSARLAPLISLSFGKSFFTEDPRQGMDLNNRVKPVPVETARSYQLVVSKTIHQTDLKLTLGHETQSAEFGKIDPDQGLQFDIGPGRIRYLAATLRHAIPNGWLQATFEQADARLVDTSFSIIPEAPRLIADLVGTYQKLPFRLQAKGEFEYVGRKVVGNGCSEAASLSGDPNALNYYCVGLPNKELRFALGRPFLQGRLNVGVNAMIASGWTGQTTENFALAGVYGPGKVGLGPDRLVPANPV